MFVLGQIELEHPVYGININNLEKYVVKNIPDFLLTKIISFIFFVATGTLSVDMEIQFLPVSMKLIHRVIHRLFLTQVKASV